MMVLSSTFEGVARVAARLPPMARSSNATLSTALWSRSCSLKFTRACGLVKGQVVYAPLRNKVERGRCRPRPRRIAAPRLATPHNNSSCC